MNAGPEPARGPRLPSPRASPAYPLCVMAGPLLMIGGGFVIAGWIFDIQWLQSISPAWITVKVNTAACFVLLGVSLWCLSREHAPGWQRVAGRISALVVGIVAGVSLAEHLLDLQLGIGQALLTQPPTEADPAAPGRMSAATATAFLLVSTALLGLDFRNRRGHRPVLALALLTGLIGLLAVVGYTYGVRSPHAFSPFSSMAVYTAILFVAASVGILCARPDRGLLGVLTGDGIGTTIARRILPVAIFLPLAIGWLRLEGERAGLYGFEFGLALFATVNVAIFATLVWITAVSLNRGDAGRRRAEESLARFRMAMETSLDGIFLMDFETFRYLDVNETGCRMLGYTREELLGMRTLDTNVNLSAADQRHRFEAAKSLGSDRVMVEPEGRFMRHRHGAVFPIEVARRYVRIGDHEFVVGIARDITERKRTQEQLRASERLLRRVLDGVGPSLFVGLMTPDGILLEANQPALAAANLKPDDVLSKPVEETYWWSYSGKVQEQLRSAIRQAANGLPCRYDVQLRIAPQTFIWVDFSIYPLRDSAGRIEYLVPSGSVITERKSAEEALRESDEKLRLFVAHAPAAIAMFDRQMRYLACSGRWLEDYGLRGDIIGRSHYDVFPDLPQRWKEVHLRCLDGAVERCAEDAYPRNDGTIDWTRWEAHPWHAGDGTIGGIILFSEVITARKQAEEKLERSEAKYRGLIDQASDGIFVSDTEGRFVLVNSAACALLGYSEAELLGKPESETYVEDEKALQAERLRRVLGGETLRFERLVRRKGGETFPAEVSVKLLDNRTIQGIFQDITKRRAQERKIGRLSRIHAVLSGINSAIVRIRNRRELFQEACRIVVEQGKFNLGWIGVLDHSTGRLQAVAHAGMPRDSEASDECFVASGGFVPAGAAAAAIRDRCATIDNMIEAFSGAPESDAQPPDTLQVRRAAIALGAKSVIVLPLVVERQTYGILTLYAPERDFFDDEELKLLDELAGDISFGLEFIARDEKADYLAYYDALTGLPNRSLFFDRLGHQLGTAAREKKDVALVLLNLDRFRLVNDTLGRKAGDELLSTVAKRLREGFRDQDGVARIGADIFAVAITGTWSGTDAAHVLQSHYDQLFGRQFRLDKEDLYVSATLGVAVFENDGEDTETLFANAEAALRNAKQKNSRLQFYAPKMNARIADSLRMENKLRRALENGEMALWYQPKVDVTTGRLTGFEALMRWQDPENGMVAPAQFIPLMEETGLILDAGRWALFEVARDCATWKAAGIHSARVAVNASPIQLRQRDFVATITNAAQAAAIAGASLDIEITEGVIMENIEAIIPILRKVRDLGVEIAVDDFGTGYSSLAYIARLPIHSLKIDRSFVTGLTENQDSVTLVKSIISLAHALHLKVVAEGVETENQAALLKAMNCDDIQGYLLSRPVPAAEVPALVHKFENTPRPPHSGAIGD